MLCSDFRDFTSRGVDEMDQKDESSTEPLPSKGKGLGRHYCLLPSCGNAIDNTDPSVTRFHRIPEKKYAAKREAYFDACGLVGSDRQGNFICTDHFKPEHLTLTGKRPVKPGVLPTLNLDGPRVKGSSKANRWEPERNPTAQKRTVCVVPSCKNTSWNSTRNRVRFIRLPREMNMQLEYLKAAGLPLKTKRKSFICTDHFEPSEVDLRNQRAVASKTRPSIRLEWNEDDLRQRTDGGIHSHPRPKSNGRPFSSLMTTEQLKWLVVKRHEMDLLFRTTTKKNLAGGPSYDHLWEDITSCFNEQFGCNPLLTLTQIKRKMEKVFEQYSGNSRELARSKGKSSKTEWFDLMDARFRCRAHPEYQDMMVNVPGLLIQDEVTVVENDEKGVVDVNEENVRTASMERSCGRASSIPMRKFDLCHDIALLELVAKYDPYSVDVDKKDSRARTAVWHKVADKFNEKFEMPVKMDVNLCKRHMKRLLEAYRGGAWRQKSSLVAATMEELEKVDVLLNKCSTSSEDFRQGRLVQMDGYSLREDRKPVTRCIVASCSSSDMQGNYNEVPRFFHVPILAEARDEYVRVIGVPANRISKNSKICDRHFTAEDFNERGKLRKGVFPSLELPECEAISEDEREDSDTEEGGNLIEEELLGSRLQELQSVDLSYSSVPKIPSTKLNSHCVIAHCENKKSQIYQKKLSFFRCPSRPAPSDSVETHSRYRRWLAAISLNGGPTEWSDLQHICFVHFKKSHLVTTYRSIITRKRAYPTENLIPALSAGETPYSSELESATAGLLAVCSDSFANGLSVQEVMPHQSEAEFAGAKSSVSPEPFSDNTLLPEELSSFAGEAAAEPTKDGEDNAPVYVDVLPVNMEFERKEHGDGDEAKITKGKRLRGIQYPGGIVTCVVPSCKNTSQNIDRERTAFMETPKDAQKWQIYREATGLPDLGFRRYHICTDHFPLEAVQLKSGVPVKRGFLPSIAMKWTEEDLQRRQEGTSREKVGRFIRCVVPSCMNTSRNIDPTRTTFMETARDPDKYEEFRRASGLPDCGFKRYHICTDHFPPEDVFLKKGVPVRRGVMPSIRMEWTEEDLQQWKGSSVRKKRKVSEEESNPNPIEIEVVEATYPSAEEHVINSLATDRSTSELLGKIDHRPQHLTALKKTGATPKRKMPVAYAVKMVSRPKRKQPEAVSLDLSRTKGDHGGGSKLSSTGGTRKVPTSEILPTVCGKKTMSCERSPSNLLELESGFAAARPTDAEMPETSRISRNRRRTCRYSPPLATYGTLKSRKCRDVSRVACLNVDETYVLRPESLKLALAGSAAGATLQRRSASPVAGFSKRLRSDVGQASVSRCDVDYTSHESELLSNGLPKSDVSPSEPHVVIARESPESLAPADFLSRGSLSADAPYLVWRTPEAPSFSSANDSGEVRRPARPTESKRRQSPPCTRRRSAMRGVSALEGKHVKAKAAASGQKKS